MKDVRPAEVRLIDLERKVTEKNDQLAAEIRGRLRAAGVFTLNLLSDLMTQNDARRIARLGVPSVQIQTRGSCHLDSRMVASALEGVDLRALDLLFIENVGNLVCPNAFDLGEDGRVVLASVADGADKPAKYPYIFENAAAVVLNKIDLLPYVPFDAEEFARDLRRLNPRAPLFRLSCLTGEGFPVWLGWLQDRAAGRGME
jgi:hydrogenase nickel incorporation protein HypB